MLSMELRPLNPLESPLVLCIEIQMQLLQLLHFSHCVPLMFSCLESMFRNFFLNEHLRKQSDVICQLCFYGVAMSRRF